MLAVILLAYLYVPMEVKYMLRMNADYTVSVINTATDTVSATITVGTEPFGVSVSPDGSKVYVANYSGNTDKCN